VDLKSPSGSAFMARQFIRIVAVPPGEAPLWVREKWVGLCLPVADSRGLREAYVSGVLAGPRNRLRALSWRFLGKLDRRPGYAVYVRDAVSELEKTAPDAAAWWRQNALRMQAAGRKFLFQAPCCELVQPDDQAGNPGDLPIPPDHMTTPPAGLSPVPQIPLHQTVARGSSRRLLVATVLVIVLISFGWLWNWNHPIHPERQILVHGNLVDWSVRTYSSRGSYVHRTVHLRISGRSEEFRIDPSILHDLMGNRLPAGFSKGAAIDITADANQLAAPIHPLLNPGVAIVWVNGLAVNGATAFSLRDVLRDRRSDWIGWLALAAMAAVSLGYALWNARRRSANAPQPSA
jgi:hypothetical protein